MTAGDTPVHMTADDTPVERTPADAGMIPIPADVRALLEEPNFVHLSTVQPGGSPRNHVVWVGVEGDHVLVCTYASYKKAKDMRRDPRVALSVFDQANPYRMAALEGRVVEVRPDPEYQHMDRIAVKYTGAPFPDRRPGHVCFVIGIQHAYQRTLGFTHHPGAITST